MSTLKSTGFNLGYQQITGLSLVQSLTVPVAGADSYTGNPAPAFAVIQAEGQPVRWRDDGTMPTPTVGMILPAGGTLNYDGNLNAIRFVEVQPSAKLSVVYYA